MDVTTLTPVTLFDGTEILVGLQDGLFKSFPAASFRGKQGPTGIQGVQGNQGQAGSLWWTGSGIPVNGYGSTNDYYLNVNNGDVYTNTAGIWGAVIGNIRGPQGIQGVAGNGVPLGGATGYVLTKNSAADNDTAWRAGSTGGGSSPVTLIYACNTFGGL